ncbi:MAG: hypothetical protein AB8B74_09710 [Crocinitomicaceae bacterium]
MKFLIHLLVIFFTHIGLAQTDTLDVFIVDDSHSENDSAVYDGALINLKCDIAKLYRADMTFSCEVLLKRSTIAIEPELTAYWQGAEDYSFNYFTANKISQIAFFDPFLMVGAGFTVKKYLSKSKGIEGRGFYVSAKVRDRFTRIHQEYDIPFSFAFTGPSGPKNFKQGLLNIVDLHLNLGLSLWFRSWIHLDFIFGGGMSYSFFKYANSSVVDDIITWTPQEGTTFLPSINYGFRVGFSPHNLISKLDQYRGDTFF